jgi:hypothetical protein
MASTSGMSVAATAPTQSASVESRAARYPRAYRLCSSVGAAGADHTGRLRMCGNGGYQGRCRPSALVEQNEVIALVEREQTTRSGDEALSAQSPYK